MIGVDPGPFTLRELAWMARGRDEAEWGRAAFLCATLVNANPFREGEPVSPSLFNPYADDARAAVDDAPAVVIPLAALKDSIIRDGW